MKKAGYQIKPDTNQRIVAYFHEIATQHLSKMPPTILDFVLDTHKRIQDYPIYECIFKTTLNKIFEHQEDPDVRKIFTPGVFRRIEKNRLDLDALVRVYNPN